jgi:hypothetical protein
MSLIGTRAMTAYMISGTEGASSTPSALALVTSPDAALLRVARVLVSRGSSSPPEARMVTPLPPVNAVKAEHNKAVATTVPRTAPPNRARNSVLSRKAAPVRAKPARPA